MAFITADRIKETTTVTGTGPINLLGAVSGYRPFASVMLSIGDTCPYAIVNANASQWEVGIATYTAANTLTRTTIHASTADPDTDPVDFTAGVKDVFLAPTASTVLSDLTSNDGTVTLTKVGSIVDLSVAIAAATENVIVQVRNNTGEMLTKGTVVYINDALGQLPTVAKALATSDATSAQTLGMISADLGDNDNGYVTIIGLIDDISLDIGTYNDGDQLYLSGTTAGAFTNVKPYAPTHLVYVGVVEHAHNVQGKIFVKVQNGYELDELHNVSAQSPSNGQTIVYNSTNQLWEKNYVSRTNSLSAVPVVSGAGNSLTLTAGSGIGTGAGGSLVLQAGIQATSGGDGKVVVKQVAGQTGNPFEYQNSTSTTKLAIQTDGTLLVKNGSGSSSDLSIRLVDVTNTGITIQPDRFNFYTNGTVPVQIVASRLGVNVPITPGSNILEIRNSISPQILQLYNTYTSASVYERASLSWASNVCTLTTESTTAGAGRNLVISAGNGVTTGAGGNVTITAGNGSGVGAGGNIILQPGAQGTSGGNGTIQAGGTIIQTSGTTVVAIQNTTTDANTVSPTPRISFATDRSGTAYAPYFFRGRLFVPDIGGNYGTQICIGHPGGPESSGYWGEGIGRVVGNGGIALYAAHAPRLWLMTSMVGVTTSLGFGSLSTSTDVAIGRSGKGVLRIADGASSSALNTTGGSLSFPSSTTAFSTNTNDLALTASAFQRINCTAVSSLTGIAPPTSGTHVDGRMIRIYNVGSYNLTLSHNSASSTTGNKFYNATEADIILAPNDYAELIYDSTNNGSGNAGWRVA